MGQAQLFSAWWICSESAVRSPVPPNPSRGWVAHRSKHMSGCCAHCLRAVTRCRQRQACNHVGEQNASHIAYNKHLVTTGNSMEACSAGIVNVCAGPVRRQAHTALCCCTGVMSAVCSHSRMLGAAGTLCHYAAQSIIVTKRIAATEGPAHSNRNTRM